MKRFLIIGGGAAGMLASVYAVRNGMEVHLFEQNEKLGKKLFITGKGRCNLPTAVPQRNCLSPSLPTALFIQCRLRLHELRCDRLL